MLVGVFFSEHSIPSSVRLGAIIIIIIINEQFLFECLQ